MRVRRAQWLIRDAASRVAHIVRTRSQEPLVVCVVGMHRSGTSALAGMLGESGLYFGRMVEPNPYNPRGDREYWPIRHLHDSILAHSGGSWDAPPARVSWTSSHVAQRDEIVRSFAPVRVWGFKDPRTLLLPDFWRDAVPRLQLVGTFRHPHAVAASHLARDGGSVDQWLDLWAAYNERLVALYEQEPFPVVSFDVEESTYRAVVGAVSANLGLRPPRRLGFFDPRFRSAREQEDEPLPPRVSALYARLEEIAATELERWGPG